MALPNMELFKKKLPKLLEYVSGRESKDRKKYKELKSERNF